MRYLYIFLISAAEIKNTNSMMAKLKLGGQPNQGNNRGETNIIPGQSGMSVSLQWQTYSKKLLENRGKSPNRQPQGAFMVCVAVKLTQ